MTTLLRSLAFVWFTAMHLRDHGPEAHAGAGAAATHTAFQAVDEERAGAHSIGDADRVFYRDTREIITLSMVDFAGTPALSTFLQGVWERPLNAGEETALTHAMARPPFTHLDKVLPSGMGSPLACWNGPLIENGKLKAVIGCHTYYLDCLVRTFLYAANTIQEEGAARLARAEPVMNAVLDAVKPCLTAPHRRMHDREDRDAPAVFSAEQFEASRAQILAQAA